MADRNSFLCLTSFYSKYWKARFRSIDKCLNFKMRSEAVMIHIIHKENFFVTWYSDVVPCIVPKVSSHLPIECQQLPHSVFSKRKLCISRELLTREDSKKHKGPKKSLRVLKFILLGYKCVIQTIDIWTI